MRSIQLVAQRTLEQHPLPDPPDPGPGQLLIKLRAVGICGSDLHWYLDGRVGRYPAAFPQVLGHEPVGEVLRAGPGTHLREGDRVVIEPTISCGHCEYCLAGSHNNCVNGVFMGGPQAHGFFLDYCTIPEHNATPVPAAMSDRQATLIEPVAVMAHMLDLVRIRAGDTVAITGAGPIGMLCAAIARASGAARVIICDPVGHRVELARLMGATLAVSSAWFVQAVADETQGRGADVVLEAAGSADAINAAFTVARPAATVVQIGIPSEIETPIELHIAMGKELAIQTIKRSNHCAAKAIRLIETGIFPDALITHVLPLAQTPAAFETLANYRDGVGKIVIEINS